MARRSWGSVYRKSKGTSKSGRSLKAGFYRARYGDENGEQQDHVIVLDNGMTVSDKGVAERWLDLRRVLIERRAVGLIDPQVEAATRPIRDLLAEYVRWMRNNRKKTGTPYKRRFLRDGLTHCKWMFAKADITKLAHFQRRRIETALSAKEATGVSDRTVNIHRRAVHHFAEWLKDSSLLQANPVDRATIRRGPTRKNRMALTVDEAYRLLAVSEDRRLYYAVALWTGLRVNECRQLQWGDLELGDRPCIRLRAETTKSERSDEIPLHPDLAKMLVDAKPKFACDANAVFGTVPRLKTFKGYHFPGRANPSIGDLQRAGIDAEDDKGRSVDLHALRTTFGTWLASHGVTRDARRLLLRHAATDISDRHYLDVSLLDLWIEIEKLPAIRWNVDDNAVRETGTGG